jgi:hypothetical protein
MAAPPTEAELTRSATTIDSLPVEILTEVLLCVPTPAALATPEFLARYRKRHKSSPFLGLYVPPQLAGPPSFHMPDSIRLADDDAREAATSRMPHSGPWTSARSAGIRIIVSMTP